ncbi:MAG: hypothetical protein M0Z51_01255 [Propionibacterium sp.]|nr:hypothetical protein [Propionibacterium sp.]
MDSPLLSEATGLINALNPEIRGAQLALTDEVKALLGRLRVDVQKEGLRLVGEEVKAVADAVPDSTINSYRWVLARIDDVIGVEKKPASKSSK